jgi:hypothetical protein
VEASRRCVCAGSGVRWGLGAETPAGRQLGRIAAEAGTDAHTTVAQRTEVVDRSPAAVVAATRLGSGARGRGSTRVVDGGFGKQESAGM